MTYTPNFTDARVRRRCQRAMGWACGVLSSTKSHAWSTRYIDRYFGIASNPLSGYLRQQLLICTDPRYRFGALKSRDNKCKEYILNESGLQRLQENLKFCTTAASPIALDLANNVLQVADEDHAAELASGAFEYKDQSDRLWHPLQRYRRQYKQQILSSYGYTHQYDIATCAPTLIHQAAQQAGMDLYLPALRSYLENKTQIRSDLACQLELPTQAVKEIVNALFAGAVISRHEDSDIFHVLAGDLARIELLKHNPFIQQLKSDIKTCWEYLRPQMQRRTRMTRSGRERLLPVTSKQKWHLYFQLERRAMTAVRTYLDMNKNKYFLEHDGWTCESPVERDLLKNYVREHAGFDLNFEYAKISHIL